jgi:curved DNA-binding protein
MIFKDYYKILELKTNRVSSEEIKNAYRLAVKKNHPDLNVEDKLAEEKIKDINEAYKVLSESSSKRKYDRIWNKNNMKIKQQQYKEENKKNNASFGEFFNMFFGTTENIVKPKINKQEKNPINGENIETSIDVDIEEVFYGLDKKISLRTVDGKMKVFTVSIPARTKKW